MGVGQVGNCKTNTMTEIWNSPEQKQLRQDMLTETKNDACGRCYEQEESGFFSGRQSANKHHGHHIHRTQNTEEDGQFNDFEMTYWDIRFSNLCNLSCRSCGHIFSSSWYKDQVQLAGPEWEKNNSVLNYAGRFKTDMMEQLMEHLDHVEQIYFAGGEPLMMDEHYVILEELERRGRFDVRLIYNSNFTQVKLKDRMVFDYWKKFDSVAVGASLDAMGPRAEYIRKGTKWQTVEDNRRQMMEICLLSSCDHTFLLSTQSNPPHRLSLAESLHPESTVYLSPLLSNQMRMIPIRTALVCNPYLHTFQPSTSSLIVPIKT
jgi:organic radical activating enzyme